MSSKCAYTIEKAIAGCSIRRWQECVWWASEQTEGSCSQLRLTQLAIFIFRRAIPGMIKSQVALAHTLVSHSRSDWFWLAGLWSIQILSDCSSGCGACYESQTASKIKRNNSETCQKTFRTIKVLWICSRKTPTQSTKTHNLCQSNSLPIIL